MSYGQQRDSTTVTAQRFITFVLVDCHNIIVIPLLLYAPGGPGAGDEAVESM